MLNSKPILARIASWDNNGNAVYVGTSGKEKFRIEISGINLLVNDRYVGGMDEFGNPTGDSFDALYDVTSIFSFNKIVATSLATGRQVTRTGNFKSTSNELNITLIDKIYSPVDDSLDQLVIWTYYNKERPHPAHRLKNTMTITPNHGEVTFNVRANKTIEHIQFFNTSREHAKFRLEGNDLLLINEYNYLDNDNSVIRLKGFYNYDNPNNQLKTLEFYDQTFSFEQFKQSGLTLSGTENNDTMYDWNKSVNSIFQAGLGNDRINAGNGDDVLIGEEGDDVLIGGNGKDRYEFSKGHGKDIVTEFNTTKDDDTLLFHDVKFNEVKFRRDNYDLTLFGYNQQDSVTIKAFFANQANQPENYQFSDRTLTLAQFKNEMALVNNQVNQMIQAMSSFGASSAGNAGIAPKEEVRTYMDNLAASV